MEFKWETGRDADGWLTHMHMLAGTNWLIDARPNMYCVVRDGSIPDRAFYSLDKAKEYVELRVEERHTDEG